MYSKDTRIQVKISLLNSFYLNTKVKTKISYQSLIKKKKGENLCSIYFQNEFTNIITMGKNLDNIEKEKRKKKKEKKTL